MAELFEWTRDQAPQALPRAAELLALGQLVALPTDTFYSLFASGLDVSAVQSLARLGVPLAISLGSVRELEDWAPYLPTSVQRLAKHSWPGALTLRVPARFGLAQRLPSEVRELLVQDGLIALRLPNHPAPLYVSRMITGPLVLAELPGAISGLQLYAERGAELGMILHDGPPRFGVGSTVVRVSEAGFAVDRMGVLRDTDLAERARCLILFVCTGNTCRSPMAMTLCRRQLAERLGCDVKDLATKGYEVASAGLAAQTGEPASPEAVDLMAELETHHSQLITASLLARADFLFTMTQGHQRMLWSVNVPLGVEPRLVNPEDYDVVDPIGNPAEVYEACARELGEHLEYWMPEILQR